MSRRLRIANICHSRGNQKWSRTPGLGVRVDRDCRSFCRPSRRPRPTGTAVNVRVAEFSDVVCCDKGSRAGMWNLAIFVVGLIAAMVALQGGSTALGAAPASFCSPDRVVGNPGGGNAPLKVRVIGAPKPVRAGHSPAFRIVNEGTAEISLGAERTLHWENGSWVRMAPPPGAFVSLEGIYVAPESLSDCLGPPTWAEWPPGKYRWVPEVSVVTEDGLGRHRLLRATFWLRR